MEKESPATEGCSGAEAALAFLERFRLPEQSGFGAVPAALHFASLLERSRHVRRFLLRWMVQGQGGTSLALVFLLRQGCLELAKQVRRCLEPLEALIGHLETRLRGTHIPSGQVARDSQALYLQERDRTEDELRAVVRHLGASEKIAVQLPRALAEVDRLCRVLEEHLQALTRLAPSPQGDQMDALLTHLLELQLLLDVELRRLLMEEPLADDIPCFRVGVLTWASQFLAEAGARAAEAVPVSEPPEPSEATLTPLE